MNENLAEAAVLPDTEADARKTDDLVEFLCLRMYPDKLTVSVQSEVVSGNRKQEAEAYLRGVEEYEKELRALSPDALLQLIADERDKDKEAELEKAAHVEAERFFNKPTATAYYRSWVERNHWTLDDATALILGKDPKVVNWGSIDPLVHKSAFARRYESLRRQFLRARFDGMLFEPLVPADFLRYAKSVGFALPVELDALLRSDDEEQARQQKHAMDAIRLAELQKAVDAAISPPDLEAESKTKTAPAPKRDIPQAKPVMNPANDRKEEKAAATKPADTTDKAAAKPARFIDILPTEPEPVRNGVAINEDNESAPGNSDRPAGSPHINGHAEEDKAGDEDEAVADALAGDERKALLKIFAAMAVGRYGFEPGSRRNSTVTDIVRDHKKIGLAVSPKTVRKWLREASELVPDQDK